MQCLYNLFLAVFLLGMMFTVDLCVLCALHFTNGQDFRLPGDVIPSHYDLRLLYDIDPATNFSFFGVVDILLTATKQTSKIVLHAKDLNIVEDQVRLITVGPHIRGEQQNKDFAVTTVTIDTNDFLTLNLVEELLTSEVYSLSIPFYGCLKMDLIGAYINAYNDKKTTTTEYSVIAVFEPIYARTAFPCFDEPMLKATFKISIGHHKDYHAISNMPLEYSSEVNENSSGSQASWPWNVTKYKNDFVWDHFGTTVRMSTYLVSYVVSKFVHVESPRNISNTTMKVWARRDVIEQANFAATFAPKILSYIEKMFNISYILPKLDHIAVKNYFAGGFEGWGLITYDENGFLYSENDSTWEHKTFVLNLMAHEISHQWFGNQVTMKWWSGLWLKEGFANFLGDSATAAVWPYMKETLIVNQLTKVFDMDSLMSSHPVTTPMEATSLKRILEIYDDISYSKAALLIRMLYKTLGEKAFTEAIHNYLAKHSYKYTVEDDLWEQLNEAALKHQTMPRNVTVARVMAPWTAQTGYPIITVVRDYNSNSLAIFQQRYITEDNSLRTRRSHEAWWVPLSVLAQRDQQGPVPITWLPDDEGIGMPHRYQHAASEDEWLLFNVDMIALCRVNYDTRNWKLLIAALTSSNYTTIPILSRVQLLLDAFELAWTNALDYGIVFELASYLPREEDHRPLIAALQCLDLIGNLLKRSSDYGIYQQYVWRLTEETYERVGGLAKKAILRANNYNSVMMQVYTSKCACRMDVPECQENAMELFHQWMQTEDPDTNNPIPLELRPTVYCEGVARGSKEHWNFMLERMKRASGENEVLSMYALACTKEAWLLYRTLQLTLMEGSDNLIGGSSTNLINTVIINSPLGYYVAKDFIYKKSDNLFARYKNETMQFLKTLLLQFTSQDELDEFLIWRDKYAKFLESSTYNIEQGIEKARINIGWLKRNRQLVLDKMNEFNKNIAHERVSLKQSSKATRPVLTCYLIYLLYLV